MMEVGNDLVVCTCVKAWLSKHAFTLRRAVPCSVLVAGMDSGPPHTPLWRPRVKVEVVRWVPEDPDMAGTMYVPEVVRIHAATMDCPLFDLYYNSLEPAVDERVLVG